MRDEDDTVTTLAPEEAPPAADELARLQTELLAAQRRAEELVDRTKKVQADYENLVKRTAREVEEVREAANEALLASLLPVLDDFDSGLAALPKDAGEGLRMLYGNLWKVLREAGLEAISPAGERFDPFDHEVVGQAADEALPEDTVREVVQTGYRYRRRLLRPAKVIVVKRGV